MMLEDVLAAYKRASTELIAIESWDRDLSYGELESDVRALIEILQGTEGAIATMLPAGSNYVVALLASLELERAILPLAIDTPTERLQSLFDGVTPGVLIVDHDASISADAKQILPSLVTVDRSGTFSAPSSDSSSGTATAVPDDCAYFLTTSGSTGRPKMIAGSRAGLEHFIAWESTTLDSQIRYRVSFLSPPVFDVSLRDILLPLSTGGTLCVPRPSLLLDAVELLKWLDTKQVDLVHIVPTLMRTMLSLPTQVLSSHGWRPRAIVSAGEPLFKSDVDGMRQYFGANVAVWNVYGPSETSLAKCFYECPAVCPDTVPLPLGAAISDTDVRVFDDGGKELSAGQEGQIGIRTRFPSLGYFESGTLRPLPTIVGSDGDAFFPTGDIGEFSKDGTLLIHGRSDRQVKIRGQRVELGAIETVLRGLEDVSNAALVCRPDLPGGVGLVAYVVLQAQSKWTVGDIQKALSKSLPNHMLPARFVLLPSLPLTKSGKVSTTDLPGPVGQRPELSTPFVAASSALESQIVQIWETHLLLDKIGVQDTFFSLGGSSLLAQKLVANIREVVGIALPVARFFEYPTVAGLAQWIAGAAPNDADNSFSPSTASRRPVHDKIDVAIVGVAGSFPNAENVEKFWEDLLQRRDSIQHFDLDDVDSAVDKTLASRDNYIRARGLMPDVDAFDARHFGISPREAEFMDPQQRVFLQTSWHALEDAAMNPDEFGGRIGVFAGCGDNTYLWNYVLKDREAFDAIGEHQIHLSNERDYLATRVAYKLDLRGPAINVSTGCSTALVAVCQAVESIRSGQCDAALAGGVYIPAPHVAGYLYQEGGFGSSDGKCRPFDKRASGTVFSSGTAAVVLRRLDDAIDDGDQVYGVIKGVALNNDGADKMSFMAPSVRGQRDVIRSALDDANVAGKDIDYVEAHGTATPIGDPMEVAALADALQTTANDDCWIGSVKGNVGHTDAAAGAVGLIKVAKAMQTGQLPGTANFEHENPELGLQRCGFTVPKSTLDWRQHKDTLLAGVSSFGVGGTNAHVVLESLDSPAPEEDQRPIELILLSAASEQQLSELASNCSERLRGQSDAFVANAAYSLARGRKRLCCRTFCVANSQSIGARLGSLANSVNATAALTNPGVAFVFPGQGSQHIGMGAGLYQHSAVFRSYFDKGADIHHEATGLDLRELLFAARPAEDDAEETLLQTRVTQPALYLVQTALAQHWLSLGISPVAVLGHSIGEYAAATIAGVMDFEVGLKLVEARGRLLQEQATGTMLSVRASATQVDSYLTDEVQLAAVNAPELCVLSGPTDAVAAVEESLRAAGIESKALLTSHAFHSAMMEPARESFARILQSVTLHEPSIPIVSTVTGEFLKAGEASNPEYWSSQLRSAVRFSDAINTVWSDDCPILLEVGPRAVASTLARQHITDRDRHRVVSSLTGAVDPLLEWQDVQTAAGNLWVNGVELDWSRYYSSVNRRIVSMSEYPFLKSRYWIGRSYENELLLDKDTAATVDAGSVMGRLCELVQQGAGFLPNRADCERTFLDLGLDSLFLTQFGIQLYKRFGIQVGLRDLIATHSSIVKLNKLISTDSKSKTRVRQAVASHLPPVDGAFVGRDQDGILKWYFEDAENDGNFMQVVGE